MRTLLPPPLLPAILFLAAGLVAGPAAAQVSTEGMGGLGRPLRPNAPAQGARPPPPALPGLAARQRPAPIPGDPGQFLSPNAALFDAIARGDLAAARDAVSRGADLNARNVLGLTPLDAAVDQRRDEIAFFLLSARGTSARGVSSRPPAADGLDAPPRRGGREPPAERAARRAPVAVAVPGPPPRSLPRLFAGDGGAPRPEIGFLGFDAGRPAGAVPAPAGGSTGRGRRGS